MFLAFCFYCCCKYCTTLLQHKLYHQPLFSLLQILKIFRFFVCCKGIITGGISTRGFSYGAMFTVGIFIGEKIPRQFSGGYFPGGSFIKPPKSFNNCANFSTQSKQIQRCKYKLFKLVQIIQRSVNHSTQYKSFNVVKIRFTS